MVMLGFLSSRVLGRDDRDLSKEAETGESL